MRSAIVEITQFQALWFVVSFNTSFFGGEREGERERERESVCVCVCVCACVCVCVIVSTLQQHLFSTSHFCGTIQPHHYCSSRCSPPMPSHRPRNYSSPSLCGADPPVWRGRESERASVCVQRKREHACMYASDSLHLRQSSKAFDALLRTNRRTHRTIRMRSPAAITATRHLLHPRRSPKTLASMTQ